MSVFLTLNIFPLSSKDPIIDIEQVSVCILRLLQNIENIKREHSVTKGEHSRQ